MESRSHEYGNHTIRTQRVVCLVLMLTLIGLSCGPKPQTDSTGTIVGRVTDAATGEPVFTAAVQVVGTLKGAMTDRNGEFRIVRMDRGKYTLRASHVDYETTDVSDVTVRSGDTRADITMQMKIIELFNDPVVLPELMPD